MHFDYCSGTSPGFLTAPAGDMLLRQQMKRNLRSSVAQCPAGKALAIAFELFQCPLLSSRYEATDIDTVLGVFVLVLVFKLPLNCR